MCDKSFTEFTPFAPQDEDPAYAERMARALANLRPEIRDANLEDLVAADQRRIGQAGIEAMMALVAQCYEQQDTTDVA